MRVRRIMIAVAICAALSALLARHSECVDYPGYCGMFITIGNCQLALFRQQYGNFPPTYQIGLSINRFQGPPS